MNKDKIIKELSEMNIKLAKELDHRQEELKRKSEAMNDATKTCIRDVSTIKCQHPTNEPNRLETKLILSKLRGNPQAIEKNVEHEFARKHTLVTLKSNSVCTWIPKNSCSTLRFSIAVANGAISGIEDIHWIHKNNYSFNASNKELLTANYAFVILRNPFKRLLSFYCDKLCNQGEDVNDRSYEVAKRTMGTKQDTTFAEFIDILWRNPCLKKANEHIQDQCDFLVYKNYHDYLPLENYKQTAATIEEKTGIKLEDVRPFNSIHTSYGCSDTIELDYDSPGELIGSAMAQSKKPKAENMYNPELIKKVGSLYLSDILLYLKAIENGEEEMGYWINFMA